MCHSIHMRNIIDDPLLSPLGHDYFGLRKAFLRWNAGHFNPQYFLSNKLCKNKQTTFYWHDSWLVIAILVRNRFPLPVGLCIRPDRRSDTMKSSVGSPERKQGKSLQKHNCDANISWGLADPQDPTKITNCVPKALLFSHRQQDYHFLPRLRVSNYHTKILDFLEYIVCIRD